MAKRKRRKQNSSRSQVPPKRGISLIAGAVVIGLLILGGAYFVFSTDDTQPPAPAAQVAQVTQPQAAVEDTSTGVSAAENVPQQAAEDTSPSLPVAPQVGALAPDFTLTDITGNQVSLVDYRGKPVVVSFFHTW